MMDEVQVDDLTSAVNGLRMAFVRVVLQRIVNEERDDGMMESELFFVARVIWML